MVAYVSHLAPHEIARMDSWAQEWIAVTLCTEPVDRERLAKAVSDLYHGRKSLPVIWVDSPLLGELAARIAHYLFCQPHGGPSVATAEQVRSAVESGVRIAKQLAAGGPVGSHVREAITSKCPSMSECFNLARRPLWNAIQLAVSPSVSNRVSSTIGGPINALCQELLSKTNSALCSALLDLDRGSSLEVSCVCDGNVSALFPAMDCFYVEVCGLELPRELLAISTMEAEMARSAHYWWPVEHFIIASDRPTRVSFDASGRLHSETAKAVRYRDGWGLYAWHGVLVPGDVIERPESISIEQIESCRDAEQRRVLMERFGYQRYLIESGIEEVMRDRYGTLFRKRFSDDESLVVVRVLNPTPEVYGTLSKEEALAAFSPDTYVLSATEAMVGIPLRDYEGAARFKAYCLRVPPDTSTARQAVAWTFGMYGREYAPDTQS